MTAAQTLPIAQGSDVELLEELQRESGTTLLVVTHETEVASRARRVITLVDGKIASDEQRNGSGA